MARAHRFLLLFLIAVGLMEPLALAQNESEFFYNTFLGEKLQLDGNAAILLPSGILRLTNNSEQITGHAFHRFPLKFNSFSTNFVIAIDHPFQSKGGHGMAFVISPSMDFSKAVANSNLGLFSVSNNGDSSDHVVAIEFDTVTSPGFQDINDNHVGVDVNSLTSIDSAAVTYYNSNGKNESFNLTGGQPIHVWIDYDETEKLLNVTLAPISYTLKPTLPLLSTPIDLSLILLDYMYVGFSAATGTLTSDHYVLGWSFNKSGQSQLLDISKLPKLPQQKKPKKGLPVTLIVNTVVPILSIILIGLIAGYVVRRNRYSETREPWEEEYGPHRYSYKQLYKATKGFSNEEIIGSGGFGNVYRGLLPSSNEQIAVKKIANRSEQGLQEFVAEIVSMGRLKHKNLVQLYGYCRRKKQLLLVYDYMLNGSVDKFLYKNDDRRNLSWLHRFKILRDVASALVYLHEEWDSEQAVLHRDVKASNVMLDADMNGRLSDFGLARFHDHGANQDSTRVVGTVGYIAPELSRTGVVTTSTDVFSFGAFMLEVACGRKPIEIRGSPKEVVVLVDLVSKSFRRGGILEMSDPRLEGEYKAEEMELVLKLGLLCSHSDPAVRPTIRQVLHYLSGDATLPQIPLDTATIPPAMLSTIIDVTANTVTTYASSSYTCSEHSLYGR